MSRRIITAQFQAAGKQVKVDTYFDRVIKYIPADIVGAWVAVTGLVNGAVDIPRNIILWIAFAAGVVLTVLWTLKQTSEPKKSPAVTQVIIAAFAFTVWAFALGGPFATLAFYRPVYGSLLLILYTLIMALIIPREG